MNKAGKSTTEFLGTIVLVVIGGILIATGVMTEDDLLKSLGAAAAILPKIAYITSRSFLKGTEIKAEAAKALGLPKDPS